MKRFTLAVFLALTVFCVSAYAEIDSVDHIVTKKERGLINWINGYVEAIGTGLAPTGTKGAQAKALARRGAILDLQRNLLEFMAGVQIDSGSRMNDFMLDNTVRQELHGVIKNVEVLGGEWDGEEYIVRGRVRNWQIRTIIAPVLPAAPKEAGGRKNAATASAKKTRWTGLVIDVRHLPYVPSMTFQVCDQNGKAVYGMNFVDRSNYLQSGLCSYFTNINDATGDTSVAANPIVAKAVKLGNTNIDIFISNADAEKIRNSSYDFRKECKVIVVSK